MKHEEIEKDLEFNGCWWYSMFEGEPISQDEIECVKELMNHIRQLLDEVKALQQENEKLKEDNKFLAKHGGKALESAEKEIQALQTEVERLKKGMDIAAKDLIHAANEVNVLKNDLKTALLALTDIENRTSMNPHQIAELVCGIAREALSQLKGER